MTVDTRIMTERPHAPGRHQRSGQRPDYRAYADGTPWGSEGWGGGGTTPPAALALTAIAPTTGVVLVEASLTLTGTGFASGAVAHVGPTAMANTVVVSPTSITCSFLPTGAAAFDITVHNPDSEISNALVFTATAAAGTVLDGTIDEVKAYVNGLANDDNRDNIIQALVDWERAHKNRASLVSWLDQQTGVV